MTRLIVVLALASLGVVAGAGFAFGLWENPNDPVRVAAVCKQVVAFERPNLDALARRQIVEANVSYDFILRAAPVAAHGESLKGVGLSDRVWIALLEIKRRLHASAYDRPLDCTAAFSAEGLPRDPGAAAREALAQTHPLRRATVISYARPVTVADGWMLVRRTEFVCVGGKTLHRPDFPDMQARVLKLSQGRWTVVGDSTRKLLYRYLPLDHCPTP